jgi:N-acetylglutamate synthase-like GNAT family acetyltransferase
VTSGRVRAATAADRAATTALLTGAGSPVADLERAPIGFWIARDGGRFVGAVGLERYGGVALPRSLVVSPAVQHCGVGRELVARVERDARRAGVGLLVLLTQTAETFFRQLGYAVVDRACVPDEVQQSAQFSALCPRSAVCQSKSLLVPSTGAANG